MLNLLVKVFQSSGLTMVRATGCILQNGGKIWFFCWRVAIKAARIVIYVLPRYWQTGFKEDFMKKIKTRIFDVSEYLSSEEDMASYLEAALTDGDPRLVTEARAPLRKHMAWRKSQKQPGFAGKVYIRPYPRTGILNFLQSLKWLKLLESDYTLKQYELLPDFPHK